MPVVSFEGSRAARVAPLRVLGSDPSEIKRRDLLGGLIHEYYRKAA
jgi:hypothetical protein